MGARLTVPTAALAGAAVMAMFGAACGSKAGSPGGGDALAPTAPPPTPAASTGVKFCHAVKVNGDTPVEFELQVGSVRMRASTGQCAPATGMRCLGLPAGNHPLVLRDAGGAEVLSESVRLAGGTNYVFFVQMSPVGPELQNLNGDAAMCAGYDIN
jgi:hypothetical protein